MKRPAPCRRQGSSATGGAGSPSSIARAWKRRRVSVTTSSKASSTASSTPYDRGATSMSPVTPGGVSRRILVADDDPDGAETLAVMLRSNGHEVRVAGDGPATLEVANDFRPQVVFLDLGMPG